MSRIGAGWLKADKNGNHYISWTIDEALLPLTFDKGKKIISTANPNKTEDKHPDYHLELFIPKENEGTN